VGNVEDDRQIADATTKIIVAQGIPGDLDGDGAVDCGDIAIVKASFGKQQGQPGFDPRADVNSDGIIDVRDLAFVSQRLPVGTSCP